MASSSGSPSTSTNPPGSVSASTSSRRNPHDEEAEGPSRRRRTPTVHRWSWWDETTWELYGPGGGTRKWTCKLCGFVRTGASHKVWAHHLHEPGNEVKFCSKMTPEKRQELLDKLAVYVATAAETSRRNERVAVDPNTMGRATSTRRPPTARRTASQQIQPPSSSGLSGMGTYTYPRQSTLQQNWNPLLKEETDMAVARFFYHDHIAFNAAR